MRLWGIRLVLAVLAISPPTAAQQAIPPKILDLLRGPDRLEIPVKMFVYKPLLTFHQQYLVILRGVLSRKVVESGAVRHLHVLVKVQDEQGRWLPGNQYTTFEIPPNLVKHEVEYRTSVYMRPGSYQLGVVIFDSETGRANVVHQLIVVPEMKNDPLPELSRRFPVVEFPASLPDWKGMWPISLQMQRLEVSNSTPMRLDVVLNVTKASRSDWLYRRETEEVLAVGSVLGRISLARGCVRISVIDALRTQVVVDRQNADEVDWSKLQDAVANIDQNTIDISALENQRRVAVFTQEFLKSLATDATGCKQPDAAASTAAIISADVVLPQGAKIPRLPPLEHTQFFYFHLGIGSSWMDGVGQILSSANSRRLSCTNPQKVRKNVAEFISTLARPSE